MPFLLEVCFFRPGSIVLVAVQFGKVYQNLAIIAVILLAACILNYRAFVKPPLYPEQETSASKVKWIWNELTLPNKHVINARVVRLRDFLTAVDKLNPGQKLFLFHGEYYPDWRTLMYYRPQDETLLISPRSKRANAAHNRKYEVVLPPYTLDPAIRTVIVLTRNEPELKMNSFHVYENKYYYLFRRNLPPRFRIFNFAFERN